MKGKALRMGTTLEGTVGMFGTIAGGLVAGGVTAFAAVPFSAAAFVVGIWGTVKNYKLKKASKNDVIDRYIRYGRPEWDLCPV